MSCPLSASALPQRALVMGLSGRGVVGGELIAGGAGRGGSSWTTSSRPMSTITSARTMGGSTNSSVTSSTLAHQPGPAGQGTPTMDRANVPPPRTDLCAFQGDPARLVLFPGAERRLFLIDHRDDI